jgi:hypothetical protein
MRTQAETKVGNGVYKNGAISIPKKGRVVVEEDVGELDQFDLQSYMSSAMTNQSSRAIKPSDKQKREQQAAAFISEGEELFALSEKYQTEFVVRGNQALYELLGSVYSLGLRIEQSENSNEIIRLVQKKIKADHDIKIGSSASAMSTMVQYVIRSDKRTSARYAKVLEIAMSEDLSPEELPAYISRRGGISQIQQVESEAMAKKQGSKESAERLALLREFYKYYSYQNIFQEVTFDQEVIIHNADNTGGSETAQFAFFMAAEDPHKKGHFKILGAHDLGRSFEDVVFKYLTKKAPSSLRALEAGLRNLQKKLLQGNISSGLREQLKLEVSKPLKYAEQEAIEMETKEV